MHKVFVYGTLLSGLHNNRLLKNSELLSKETVTGLEMHDLGPFPACVMTDSPSKVTGEIWSVDDETLHNLDRLEGYPALYDRALVLTSLGHAMVYVRQAAKSSPIVEGGDWKAHINHLELGDDEGTFLP